VPKPDESIARAFLHAHRDAWTDWNVPFEDGERLYDLVRDRQSQAILEIGTSTGHSTTSFLRWCNRGPTTKR